MNSTIRDWVAAGKPRAFRPGEGDIIAEHPDGRPVRKYEDVIPVKGMRGNLEALAMYAGTSVGGIHRIATAGEVVNMLAQRL
jgi:hypothetical protein